VRLPAENQREVDEWAKFQPELGNRGFAAKVGDTISLRTASTSERNAKINALVLIFGCKYDAVHRMDEPQTQEMWNYCVRWFSESVTIVPVTCVEVKQGE
jgi:hypothetical protein